MVNIPKDASPELRAILERNASHIEAGQRAAEAEASKPQRFHRPTQNVKKAETRIKGGYRDGKMAAAGDDS